jgi:hypothetical protein
MRGHFFAVRNALCRIDDTGATLHIVCPEDVARLGGDEFKQCELDWEATNSNNVKGGTSLAEARSAPEN